jgi:hypothetical protein
VAGVPVRDPRGARLNPVDNGPKFTAEAVREWLHWLGVRTLFIELGSPWEDGYVETFNGKFRYEPLNREIFYWLTDTKLIIERWKREYNTVRLHSALGCRPRQARGDQLPAYRERELPAGRPTEYEGTWRASRSRVRRLQPRSRHAPVSDSVDRRFGVTRASKVC